MRIYSHFRPRVRREMSSKVPQIVAFQMANKYTAFALAFNQLIMNKIRPTCNVWARLPRQWLRCYCTANTGITADTSEVFERRRIAVTKREQNKLLCKKPVQPPAPRFLKVALIGAPNAGKSTLANKLLAWRYSTVSKKVHTTRCQTIGVMSEGDTQVVFLDTPGIITPSKMKKHNLERSLLADPHSSLLEAHCVGVVVDVSNVWDRAQLCREVLEALILNKHKRAVLILNKTDILKTKVELLSVTRRLTAGVVAGSKHWSLANPSSSRKKRVDVDEIFSRMEQCRKSDESPGSNDEQIAGSETDQGYIQEIKLDDQTTVEFHTATESEYDTMFAGRMSEDVNDSTKVQSESENADDSDVPIPAHIKDSVAELRTTQGWQNYSTRLRAARHQIRNQQMKGWPHFERVFMISALSGDGVWDLKNYLLDTAPRGDWLYHPSLVTNQDPRLVARQCVQEKLLDHLPNEIPYRIQVKLALWEEDEHEMLRAAFDLICDHKRQLFYALGKGGMTSRTIAIEAKQELMKTFRRELSLRLVVRLKNPK